MTDSPVITVGRPPGRPTAVIATAEDLCEVYLELSETQIDRVVRQASMGEDTMSGLVSRLAGVRKVLTENPHLIQDRRLSSSLLSGLAVVSCFPTDGGYLSNTEVARSNSMNMSTTHRYISTLLAVGLLERDPISRRYRLAQ